VSSYTVFERAAGLYRITTDVFNWTKNENCVTPMELVRHQFKGIPTSGTICIPGAGIGTYIVAALEAGFRPENITAVELDRASYELGAAIYKRFGVNYVLSDFMTWEPDVEFDVIIGNPPYSNRAKVSGANTGGCANNLDSDFFKRSMETADRVSLIIRAKHFLKPTSKFRKKLFSSGNLVSIEYLSPEIFPTVQNTQTCIVTWDRGYKGPCKITYKDGSTVDKFLTEADMVKLDNPNYTHQVPNNLAHRYFNGNLYRNAIKDFPNGLPLVEILGSGESPKIRYIEPNIEETGRNQHGVIMNMAAEWGGLGRIMIKPYEASVTFSVVFLKTDSKEEAVALRDYLMSETVEETIRLNMASFHPTKDLFRKITDPLLPT
jgi:predicted RNA methylase